MISKEKTFTTCKNCGEQAEVDTSLILSSDPPKYKYKCKHCGHVGYVDKLYETKKVNINHDDLQNAFKYSMDYLEQDHKSLNEIMNQIYEEYFRKRKLLTIESIIDIYNKGYKDYDEYIERMKYRRNAGFDEIKVVPLILDKETFDFIMTCTRETGKVAKNDL